MKYGLDIKPSGALDFVSLGALVHRLDPGRVPFRKATECAIHVSGGEFNCAANLADCFGLRAGIVTAMVDYPIGELIAERVKAMGVIPFYKRFAHDGVRGPNMAAVYSDQGFGVRPPIVFYNRANEAAALLKPGDIDWNAIFSGGVRWFHSGGIFAALSPTTAELIIEGMQAAKAAGAICSFDLNFREKLWKTSGGAERAASVIARIVKNVDVLIGNEEDLQKGLGIPGPEVTATSKLDPSSFFGMIDNVVKKHPQVKIVATTLRDVHSTSRHSWAAVAWIDGKTHLTPTVELDVLDRVGGGDGFGSGFFYGLMTGVEPEEAVRLGWAHGALLTTFPGDTTMATVEQVRAFARGGSARIQR
ncbi:MAG: sugar kinase [Vicinamibacteria bacterium]|jgi:2-dehydro-3-deoxygluconokinase|nr:sugar kinase [Vicinamibacteria bacterium]MBP9947752.1 sugar kinase [Vicinamibacteria bacterium]